MSKDPKGVKGMKRKLRSQKALTAAEVRRALKAASETIDQQLAESAALKRIIIAERAQVIYYQEKYVAVLKKECVELIAVGWLDLSEDKQTEFTKKAVKELYSNSTIAPHDADSQEVAEESKDLGKRILLQ